MNSLLMSEENSDMDKNVGSTICFGNDQFAPILGYGDLVQGNVTINRVYYVEGLNHNLFSVGQFYDVDLEIAFRKSTCFVRDLQGNDLLTAWLWHRILYHLNFDYINLLSKKDIVIGLTKLKYVKDQRCSSCKFSKAKRSSFKSKDVPSSKGRLNLLHMDLCGPIRVASINGKKYIMVIVNDYSRYTWTLFLCLKDETPEVLKDFLTMIQRNLQAPVITVRTDRGTEFLNKTLNAFFREDAASASSTSLEILPHFLHAKPSHARDGFYESLQIKYNGMTAKWMKGLYDSAGTDLVTQAETDLVTQEGTDLVTQEGTDLVTQAGTDLVTQAGTDLVTQAGTDLVTSAETDLDYFSDNRSINMASLADKAILSGADNRPLMLEKDMYDSWKSRMELYMLNRQHGRMILKSVEQGPLIWPSVEVEG
nr:hypothetical protein [Tanacetum cinerariifolium]